MNVVVPGVGHINTYPHEDVLNPSLTPLPSGYTVVGPEHYFGEREANTTTQPQRVDCEVNASNVANGRYGSGTHQLTFYASQPPSQQAHDCSWAENYFHYGDPGISTVFRHLPRAKSSMVASLLQPRLPVPVILNIAGGVFFIGAITTANICNFSSCGNTAKKVLAAVAIGFAILSVACGQYTVNATAMRTFASEGTTALSSIASEAAGSVEMTGAVSPGLASRAASEAGSISGLSASSSVSVLP